MNQRRPLICASIVLLFAMDLAVAKPYPFGVYESARGIRNGSDNVVAQTPMIPGQKGVLVRAPWGLCSDDLNCLLDVIELNLDQAQAQGLSVALAIGDGDSAPPGVKSRCELFNFTFRGQPATMCLAWDANYLADKQALIAALGARFDSHPALAHVYFTAACSTNGFEGHCRIDQAAYSTAGYTPQRLSSAYLSILHDYLDAFPTTPITFEAHTIFDSASVWQALWDDSGSSGRLGAAAWWCAERLSIRGNDTLPVWPLIQQIAQSSYAVCQTVGDFSTNPWRFSDAVLSPPLDYGSEFDWDTADVANAFMDTLDWVSGSAVHAGQSTPVIPFSAIEVWTQDLNQAAFQSRLELYLDTDELLVDGFEF